MGKISTPTVLEAIKHTLKKDVPFDLLSSLEQGQILLVIKKEKLDLRVFEKRGFDIWSDRFFALEYVLEEAAEKETK